MRFGLQIPNFTYGIPDAELFERVAQSAVAAEDGGFESVWVMDHFFQLPMLGGPDEPMLEAYTLLGALAARTSRIELGALVTGVTYRNPAMLAKIVTTLDIISGGRAILGLGAAWYDVEHTGLGFDFPPLRERFERLEDAVQICREMFTADPASFVGRHHRIDGARNIPRPLRPGGPKIMIGGGGEQRTLNLVARYADLCNVFGDADTVRHKVAVLRKHCADVGRDPAEIAVTRLSTLIVTDTTEEGAQLRETMIASHGEQVVRARHLGTADEIVDSIVPVIEAGADYLIFSMPRATPAQIRSTCELLTTRFA